MSDRRLSVLDPGLRTTVQDLGRPGLSAWGVGRSGAADRGSAALANRLVANRQRAALLEATMGGLVVRAEVAVTVALTGAPAPAHVDGRPVAFGTPVALPSGAVLRLGPPTVGLRTYVAVRGGIDVPPVLGSRSYDVLSALGPRPLRAGDVLPVGPEPKAWPSFDLVAPALALPIGPDGVIDLSGTTGPHFDALSPAAVDQLGDQSWTVSGASDRSGLRLDGVELQRRDRREWPPEGLVRGAVQLPPSGRPVVMLADHPVTGGYPAIAALDRSSCDRAAQLRPGDVVRLRLGPPDVRVPSRLSATGPA
jgi:biotin-dependent carboxylase-like uncharacterized protein